MSAPAQDVPSAAAIVEEITRTRARLSHSLMVLDREYALRNALVHGVRLLRESEIDAQRLREGMARNVIPLALIGTGLAWLILAGRAESEDVTARFMRAVAHIERLGRQLLAFAPPSRSHEPPEEIGGADDHPGGGPDGCAG